MIPTTKLESNLKGQGTDSASGVKPTKVVLVATGMWCSASPLTFHTGAYSPIHIMHIHMLEIAKQHLEGLGTYEVVAGFVSPSHDHYVSRKLGPDWIQIEDRFVVAHSLRPASCNHTQCQ